MSVWAWCGLGLLGGAGATLRHLADRRPWSIFAVNVTGAFALGVLTAARPGHDTAALLGTGLLGAYTTFSTWMLQVRVLIRDGRGRAAAVYALAALAAGLLAVWAGRGLG